jgi:hypothetical protein
LYLWCKRKLCPTPGAALTYLHGFGRAKSVPAGEGARGLVVLTGQGGGGLGPPRVGASAGSEPGSGLLHVESTGSSVKAASKLAVSASQRSSLRSGVKSGV